MPDFDFPSLSVDERMRLIEALWESIEQSEPTETPTQPKPSNAGPTSIRRCWRNSNAKPMKPKRIHLAWSPGKPYSPSSTQKRR